jgi:rhodanese-related sulfurtransferase
MTEGATEQIDLTAARLAELLSSGDAQLVDVRQQREWDAGRIAGAVHIPLERLPAEAARIDRERPVVFQCRTGSRSAMATAAFRESGYEAYNLAGGIEAWVEDGQPIEPEGGGIVAPTLDAS